MNQIPAIIMLTPITDPKGIWLMALVYAIGFAVAAGPLYILQSIALYSISHRRKIRNPWLSWVPLGSEWILGKISDQYQSRRKDKITSRGKKLLILNAVSAVSFVLMYVFMLAFMVFASQAPDAADIFAMPLQAQGALAGMILTALLSLAAGLAASILHYIALYDLFRSCDPKNGTVYLVISLLVIFVMPAASIVKQILMFVCRKKDVGMQPPQPAWRPVFPWDNAQQTETPQPPAEPWENQE